jgi:hypothetical protein
VGGLVAWAVERDVVDPELRVSRISVDMFKPVPMRPLRMESFLIREGRRIQVLGVSILDGDTEVTRATVLLLRGGQHPDGDPWTMPQWDVPGPEEVVARPTGSGPDTELSWEIRQISDWNLERGKVWLRERIPFVAGQQLSPLLRAALMADFAHPIGNSGKYGLSFINADLTLYLARYPGEEWIGMESAGHLGTDGIGIGSAWMYDQTGRFGVALVAGMPDARLRNRSG